jgi:hypothetical protein
MEKRRGYPFIFLPPSIGWRFVEGQRSHNNPQKERKQKPFGRGNVDKKKSGNNNECGFHIFPPQRVCGKNWLINHIIRFKIVKNRQRGFSAAENPRLLIN